MNTYQKAIALLLITQACNTKPVSIPYRNYIGSWSPNGERILFYSDRNGQWDIFQINSDGTQLQQITNSNSNEIEPNWHPNRNSFAFASDEKNENKIYSYNFESQTTTPLTTYPGKHTSPFWSPQGTHLAFLSKVDSLWKLVILGVKDSSYKVAYSGKTYPGRPTWSGLGDKYYTRFPSMEKKPYIWLT